MKTIVMIPTYNEKENIKKLIDKILRLNVKDLEVLVVDDNSPDGTWNIVENITKTNKKVHLLLRKTQKGRGSAGKDGFKKALELKADYIVEMDADLSHNPKYIPSMLEKIKECDVVLGSRAIKGGTEKGRPFYRTSITKLANIYIRMLLGLNIRDCNSGYRCFRRKVLEKIVDRLYSKDPAIVQEVLFKSHINGFKICEIPIMFEERYQGKSKIKTKAIINAYFNILKLKINHILGRL